MFHQDSRPRNIGHATAKLSEDSASAWCWLTRISSQLSLIGFIAAPGESHLLRTIYSTIFFFKIRLAFHWIIYFLLYQNQPSKPTVQSSIESEGCGTKWSWMSHSFTKMYLRAIVWLLFKMSQLWSTPHWQRWGETGSLCFLSFPSVLHFSSTASRFCRSCSTCTNRNGYGTKTSVSFHNQALRRIKLNPARRRTCFLMFASEGNCEGKAPWIFCTWKIAEL